MSRLIFEGDTVSRFGKSIPTPFIEKIKIYENDIVADIAIYLHITDDDEINQSIYEDLSNLELYAGLGVIYRIPDRLELGTIFELVSDNIYNNEGQRFAKFMYSRSSIDREMQDFSASDRAISINRSIYYSCFIAIAKDEAGTLNKELHSFKEVNQFDREGLHSVYKNFSSPLIYEKVFSQRVRRSAPQRLATEPIVIYEDSSGVPYEDTPLESIQRNYYKTTDNFRILLKDQLQGIVDTFSGTQSQQALSFVDSISFIAETKNADVDFIVELDKLRNSFPSRTSTSELGLLYNQLKTVLFAANDTLILGDPVTKKIVPNTKLIDLRDLIVFQVEEWSRKNTETYEPRPDDTGDILYSNVLMERQQLETKKFLTLNEGRRTESQVVYDGSGTLLEPNYDITSTFGYFFFDYEKSLHKKSNISQIYEVQKLLNVFGNNSLDAYFSIKKTEMIRFSRTILRRKIITPYIDNRPLTNLIEAPQSAGPKVVYKVVEEIQLDDEQVETKTDIPYVMPRGFDTVQGLDGYRLMAFEFQDYEDTDSSTLPGGSYRFNVFIEDDTLDFYDTMVKMYEECLEELRSYLNKAEDFCSYNNIDGRFNDFFLTAIVEQYSSEEEYPWIKVPKIFSFHLDLINNQFGEQLELMLTYASNISATISPENGTLLALQNFVYEMTTFYEKYYGETGEITKIVSSRRDTEGNFATSLRDNTEFIATLGFDDLPDVLDTTPDAQPPPVIKLWNGLEAVLTKEFVKINIGTIAGTVAFARSKKQSVDEFLEDNGGGVVDIGLVDLVFERGLLQKILGIGAATGGASRLVGAAIAASQPTAGVSLIIGGIILTVVATVALILAMIFDVPKRVRTREIVRFINKFISRIQNQSRRLTYEGKKALIEREFRFAFGDSKDRPTAYKKLEQKDIDFLKGEKAKLGNIGLLTIASENKNLYDVSSWFERRTKNVRNGNDA